MAGEFKQHAFVVSPNKSSGRIATSRGDAVGDALVGSISGSIDIRIDTSKIRELADLLDQAARVSPNAVALALNRTAEQARTKMRSALKGQTGLPSGVIGAGLKLSRASGGSLVASVDSRGTYFPLKAFGPRKTRKGISANPWGKRRVFATTWQTKTALGGNVFDRVGKARFPIRKLFGPALPVEMVKDESKAAFEAIVPPVLLKRLEHELGRVLASLR